MTCPEHELTGAGFTTECLKKIAQGAPVRLAEAALNTMRTSKSIVKDAAK